MKKNLSLLLCALLLVGIACVFGRNSGRKQSAGNGNAEMQTIDATGKSDVGTSYKKEVVIGINAQVTTMDVQSVSNVVHNRVFKLSHDPLVELNFHTGEIGPKLAESWKWVNEHTIEFYLRKDVKFHNGEPMAASDVLFTFKRGETSTSTAPKIRTIREITAPDNYTVRMVLESANMDWLDTLSLPAYSILSEKACTEDPKNGHYIGTGPWVVDQFVMNNYNTYHRFEDYWKTGINTEKLTVRYIPESSARVIALQTGEIDLCLDPTIADLPFIENDKNLELVVFNSSTSVWIAFNYPKKPTNNKLLRHAIAHAIDREEIILGAMGGYAVPAKTFWGPTQFGYYDGFQGYEFDLDKARKLLVEAGYPNGVDLELTVTTSRITQAEITQAQLKKIGVNVIINEVDSAAMTSITNDERHQAILFGLSHNTAGDDIRRVYGKGSSTNRSHYYNERVIELMDLAVTEIDTAKRLTYYKELQEIAAEDLPVIPLYYDKNFVGIRKGLNGVDFYGTSNFDMSFVHVIE